MFDVSWNWDSRILFISQDDLFDAFADYPELLRYMRRACVDYYERMAAASATGTLPQSTREAVERVRASQRSRPDMRANVTLNAEFAS